jgi:hypothetical protein
LGDFAVIITIGINQRQDEHRSSVINLIKDDFDDLIGTNELYDNIINATPGQVSFT